MLNGNVITTKTLIILVALLSVLKDEVVGNLMVYLIVIIDETMGITLDNDYA